MPSNMPGRWSVSTACACSSSTTKPTPGGSWSWCWNKPAPIVTAASSAHEAMEVLPEARPDVLVSDLGMPDQDGFDLIRQVRDVGNDAKELPAVALTAFVQKDDARLALLAGFQVHVPKPVDPHELTSVIARLAGRPS